MLSSKYFIMCMKINIFQPPKKIPNLKHYLAYPKQQSCSHTAPGEQENSMFSGAYQLTPFPQRLLKSGASEYAASLVYKLSLPKH